ncbi:hypothetical protein, partial [Desulfofundulus sp.]|uniref:hypothetical protein n=1 Tax=Desulfofundulus sp. TaxID=2282750 RepID=UPI003C7942F9
MLVFKRNSFLCAGLDLEGPEARAVLIRAGGKEVEVLGQAARPLPEDPDGVAGVAASLLDELNARGARVVVGLGGEG